MPFALVTVVRLNPVFAFTTVIVACPITAPETSLTAPVIWPVSSCPNANAIGKRDVTSRYKNLFIAASTLLSGPSFVF